MRHCLRVGVALWLGFVVLASAPAFEEKAQEEKPRVKPKREVYTNAAEAGPDFAIQGEYVGEAAGKGKVGAQGRHRRQRAPAAGVLAGPGGDRLP